VLIVKHFDAKAHNEKRKIMEKYAVGKRFNETFIENDDSEKVASGVITCHEVDNLEFNRDIGVIVLLDEQHRETWETDGYKLFDWCLLVE